MKIIIVGCGKIGQSILQSLISEGHEIVVVDSNREVIDSVSTNYDVMGICAAGTHFKTLSDAGADSAELFIAATGSAAFLQSAWVQSTPLLAYAAANTQAKTLTLLKISLSFRWSSIPKDLRQRPYITF